MFFYIDYIKKIEKNSKIIRINLNNIKKKIIII